jgi:hypothetical protein
MRWLSVLGLLVVGLAVWVSFSLLAEPAVRQPIQFPHKTHVQQLKLPCTTCHQRAERDIVAGRPPTTLCLACHSGQETNSQEVKKLQAFGERGQEIPWRRVWRLPSHVFFPHRTHVLVAKVKCQTCHGPMETLDRPPARPLRTLSMDDCISCHEKWERSREAKAENTKPVEALAKWRISRDCNTCHR